MNRRNFMKMTLLGIVGLIRLSAPKTGKRSKKMIRHTNSSGSGIQLASSTYNWVHSAPSPVDAKNYGIMVGVAVFGAQTVSSVTITAGGVTRNLTLIMGHTTGSLRNEVWHIADVPPVDQTVEVTLSASGNSNAGASTYAWLGGIGAIEFAGGAGGVTLITKRDNSILYGSFMTNAITGVVDRIDLPQNNRVFMESAVGSHSISDTGPWEVLPEGTEIGWEGFGGSSTDVICVELINNNVVDSSIG